MRITNRIMQNNSLFNINNNKLNEDSLSTQLATGKTLTRPSDDPVVAIRALRLRTNVSTVNQFYKKNAPDADLWLTTTEDALGTLNAVLTDMVRQANSGANEYKGVEDLSIIMTQLSELAEEVYATGDTDYAGRYIFTGYRTDTPLTFQNDMEAKNGGPTYNITEQLTRDDIDQRTYVETQNLFNMNGSTYNNAINASDPNLNRAVNENDITSTPIYRIRLAYDELDYDKDSASPIPTIYQGSMENIAAYKKGTASGTVHTYSPNASDIYETSEEAMAAIAEANSKQTEYQKRMDELQQQLTDKNQEITDLNDKLNDPSTPDEDKPGIQAQIDAAEADRDAMVDEHNDLIAKQAALPQVTYCYNTGELFLADTVYSAMNSSTDPIHVDYQKTTFSGNDFRPEHYYACTATLRDANGQFTGEVIEYNQEYLTKGRENARQEITYDVGANQVIRINTTADEVFNPSIRKDVQDLNNRLRDLTEIETTRTKLKEALEAATTETERADIQERLDAADKAQTYLVDDMNKMFGIAISKFQKYLDDTSVAITANGARAMRLELISNRLGSQKLTYEDLQSQNEDVDIAEAMVNLQSAEMTYNASLMATGKILQTSLLNYL